MRSVLDALFGETLEFTVPAVDGRRAYFTAPSVHDGLVAICELAGLELMDYDTHFLEPVDFGRSLRVTLRSRGWRERLQR